MAGGSYNAKRADVWSCGVMLFVMLFGEYPFADPHEVMMKVLQEHWCSKRAPVWEIFYLFEQSKGR